MTKDSIASSRYDINNYSFENLPKSDFQSLKNGFDNPNSKMLIRQANKNSEKKGFYSCNISTNNFSNNTSKNELGLIIEQNEDKREIVSKMSNSICENQIGSNNFPASNRRLKSRHNKLSGSMDRDLNNSHNNIPWPDIDSADNFYTKSINDKNYNHMKKPGAYTKPFLSLNKFCTNEIISNPTEIRSKAFQNPKRRNLASNRNSQDLKDRLGSLHNVKVKNNGENSDIIFNSKNVSILNANENSVNCDITSNEIVKADISMIKKDNDFNNQQSSLHSHINQLKNSEVMFNNRDFAKKTNEFTDKPIRKNNTTRSTTLLAPVKSNTKNISARNEVKISDDNKKNTSLYPQEDLDHDIHNKIGIEFRLNELLKDAQSKYLVKKINKSIDFCRRFKDNIKSNTNLHENFKFVASKGNKNTKSFQNSDLDKKYSELVLLKNKDFDFKDHMQKSTIEGLSSNVSSMFQYEENAELKLERMIKKEKKMISDKKLQNEKSKFKNHLSNRHSSNYSKMKPNRQNEILERCLKNESHKEKNTSIDINFEKSRDEGKNITDYYVKHKRFSYMVEQNHRSYNKYWHDLFDVENLERKRQHEKSRAMLDSVLKPCQQPIINEKAVSPKNKMFNNIPNSVWNNNNETLGSIKKIETNLHRDSLKNLPSGCKSFNLNSSSKNLNLQILMTPENHKSNNESNFLDKNKSFIEKQSILSKKKHSQRSRNKEVNSIKFSENQ